MNLYTTFYHENNHARIAEYLQCLQKNIENRLIKRIIILIEEETVLPLEHPKIKIINLSKRSTFQDFFLIINENTSQEEINIIANTDIYFDDTLALAIKIAQMEVYALNRWDVLDENRVRLFAKYSTGDTWIFRGKVEVPVIDYYLGQLGCDNKLLYDLKKAGYRILNPSLSIRSYHVHGSNVRGELSDPKKNNRIPAPYVYSIPAFISVMDAQRILFKYGLVYLIKLFLVRRSIRFQYYYDRKNNVIEHAYELIDSVNYKPWKYWYFHDFKLPFKRFNRFKSNN